MAAWDSLPAPTHDPNRFMLAVIDMLIHSVSLVKPGSVQGVIDEYPSLVESMDDGALPVGLVADLALIDDAFDWPTLTVASPWRDMHAYAVSRAAQSALLLAEADQLSPAVAIALKRDAEWRHTEANQ
jgi:hypothetical protein